ncbi:MAG: NUDIX hydrolase [Candidatus Latescibacteria bacterium]|jgi:ADP-ribose pyrophosphatase YjhB (NUDIX family)|nr:NUDIX hydrolase [Candidatus Latescibacterota bacterium]
MSIWVEWVKQVKAISQIGKQFSKDPYDLERYDQLQELSHEMFAQLGDAPKKKVDDFFIPDQGYATPKVDLRGAVFEEDRVLLVQERADGLWALPGGWADVCEPPSIGVVREIFEESGYRTKVRKLAAVKDRGLHPFKPRYPTHIYKMYFLCELVGGTPTVNLEVSDIDFFNLDGLPELSEGKTIAADIALMYEHHVSPELATYCD